MHDREVVGDFLFFHDPVIRQGIAVVLGRKSRDGFVHLILHGLRLRLISRAAGAGWSLQLGQLIHDQAQSMDKKFNRLFLNCFQAFRSMLFQADLFCKTYCLVALYLRMQTRLLWGF